MKVTGVGAAGAILAGNEALKIMSSGFDNGQAFALAGLSIAGGFLLDKLIGDDKYTKLFRMCGLVNKEGHVPLIIKKEKSDTHTTLVLHLPPGLSQKHFEDKLQELEQGLNCKIEIGFNKNLILKLIESGLSTYYPFEFRQCKKVSESFCGIGYSGDFYLDIEKDQHIIVSGESDSGKSSFITTLVLSYILSDKNIDLHLIDFQGVTLGVFEDCKKVKSYGETPEDFGRLMAEMEAESNRRLKLFRSVKDRVYVEKLETWNKEFPSKAMPYKFVVVDEFARLAEKDYEDMLKMFRQRVSMDRKAGIHYCISLQRPDASIIEGAIKANMSTRIAFKAVSGIDSEVILGGIRGAEKIKNQGRFLARHRGELKEVQALYIKPKEIRQLLKQYNKYKTHEDVKAERKEVIQKFQATCINPYLKGRNAP
jgi:S-DNA-T family DNA segregation ATPase FtsK/SpoIIIE